MLQELGFSGAMGMVSVSESNAGAAFCDPGRSRSLVCPGSRPAPE
uniref:Uncharacterized protein n=1 Tax=Arundo donax TaxID=35708 RepID=A0A0A9EWQ4_ARUDO